MGWLAAEQEGGGGDVRGGGRAATLPRARGFRRRPGVGTRCRLGKGIALVCMLWACTRRGVPEWQGGALDDDQIVGVPGCCGDLRWRRLLARRPPRRRRSPRLACPRLAVPAASVHFQVIDETDPQEISEDTVIFLNGVQVAHFKLDRAHAYSVADVVAPAKGPYDYALCGRITVALPDGQPEQRVVDGGASLTDVAGRTFRALAANDFTMFYLEDSQDIPASVPKDAHHTDACSLPVS